MQDKVLQGVIERKMESFFEEYFDEAPINRFEPFLAAGAKAYPVLMDALTSEEADGSGRVDALVAMGRLFEEVGPTRDSLDAVVAHAKALSDSGLNPERQAALFAIGRSQEASLIENFMPLLTSGNQLAVYVSCSVVGYAAWEPAVAELKQLVMKNDAMIGPIAIWALGEIGSIDAARILSDLLNEGKMLEPTLVALRRIGGCQWLRGVAGFLDHEDVKVRMAAVTTIQSIVMEDKVQALKFAEDLTPALHAAVKDQVKPVSVIALTVLAELGEKLDPELTFDVLQIEPSSLKE